MAITDEDRLEFEMFEGDEAEMSCRTVKMRTAAKEHPCYGGLGSDGDGHKIEKGQRYRHERARIDGSFWGEYRVCTACLEKWIADLKCDNDYEDEPPKGGA